VGSTVLDMIRMDMIKMGITQQDGIVRAIIDKAMMWMAITVKGLTHKAMIGRDMIIKAVIYNI
jgi:hypothetical protein